MVSAPLDPGAIVSFVLHELSTIRQMVMRTDQSGDDGRLAKLLVNVTVEGTLGPIHVVMSPENTVDDLIRAAVEVYTKEGRRPLLLSTDPKGFELHYSQYSLERLDPQEKLVNLGSRDFFLCSTSLKAQVLAVNNYNPETEAAVIG